ncbi:hypothetical protein LR48_Vigan09g270000 [Vigna angularis]|uniref:Protein SUPPRESSOR OF GENE SILENCING 3-like protein n=2 Tax=Phaseolus angularis TaxID=3914 RepID=A0A0L9VG53_PHAAN|nr:protein SUPPRESSOR OF GENE SILENCING 3-like [Vigna angularis]KAG2396323.1 Protein SUPPRESSOR OF GENE SILENCING 3-like protein [Vigna angularis]KOM54041.1 hypothetical protein LR48_Vigan09g270000 [Vigna angularis]BAT86797.1 hypothetical protein VIGAN_05011100 [Vigna angularis var. angularis]
MAEDGADTFPELLSVYRVSGPRSNSISDDSVSKSCFSQNSVPNVWRTPNIIQKLKLVERVNGVTRVTDSSSQKYKSNSLPPQDKSNSLSPEDKSNTLGTLASEGSETLNDSNLSLQSVLTPTLEKKLNSSTGVDATTSKDCENEESLEIYDENNDETVDNISDIVSDSDDDCSLDDIVSDSDDDRSLDDIDSDTGERSHEQCKNSKWLRNFFDGLNALANEEISSQDRQWHCPACQGIPGGIGWYKGLQSLLDHSRTIQSKRVRLHRMFAETLQEESFRRRVPLTVVCEIHDGWEGLDRCQNPFIACGKRQLYGYLDSKEDSDDFNRHSGGKPDLKFEMRSYQEMVESKINHINDDSRKLNNYKSLIAEEQVKSQVCVDSSCELSEKLSLRIEENHVDRQNKEIDAEEKSFQDQIQVIAPKGDQSVKLQHAMQEKAENTCQESVKKEENSQKYKEIMQLGSEREKIMKIHEEKWLALKKKQWQELVELEKELENELTQLMDKYASN